MYGDIIGVVNLRIIGGKEGTHTNKKGNISPQILRTPRPEPALTLGIIHQTSRRNRRNRLTGSGNPIFESYVEGKALQREIEVYSRSSLQIPHDCIHFIQAQLIRTGLVLLSSKGGSQCTQNFPALRFSLYTTFKRGIAYAYQPIPLVLDCCC